MSNFYISNDDDLIDIRIDGVFKAVFTKNTPAARGALSGLVSALIGRVVAVNSILSNEPPIDSLEDRQLRFDINCRAENGELINVEMSLYPISSEPVRLEFHVAKLFTGQDIKGTNKGYNNLKQAYQITILAKERFFPDDEFFHTFEFYDKDHNVSLNGRSRIITLELSKLKKIVEKPASQMSNPEKWGVYIEYLTDISKRGKINEIAGLEGGIAMASEVLLTISRDEEERARIMRAEKTELDYISYMAEAEEKGLAKGKLENEKYILQLIKQGLSIEEIRQYLEHKT